MQRASQFADVSPWVSCALGTDVFVLQPREEARAGDDVLVLKLWTFREFCFVTSLDRYVTLPSQEIHKEG